MLAVIHPWVCEANPKPKIAMDGNFGEAKAVGFRPRKG
jgi:hypothetical protein